MFSPFVSPYLRLMQRHNLFPSTAMSMIDTDAYPSDSSISPGDGYDPAFDKMGKGVTYAPDYSGMMGDTGTGLPNLEMPPGGTRMSSVTVGSAGGPSSSAADTDKLAMRRGLGALGAQLLAGAGTGDFGGSLARGIDAFGKTRQSIRDKADEAAAQAQEDELKRQANERAQHADVRADIENVDRHKQAGLAYDVDQSKYEQYKKDQAHGEQLRAVTGKNASQMVDDINSIAASHPEDSTLGLMSHRALGYSLGDDSDLNKLAGLHAEIVARAGRAGDVAFDTKSKIDQIKAEKSAGFGPLIEAGQSAARLGIEQRHEAAYEKEIGNKTANSQTYTQAFGKPAGWYDDVDKEVRSMIGPEIEKHNKMVGQTDQAASLDPHYQAQVEAARKAGIKPPDLPTFKPLSPQDISDLQRQAEAVAIETVNRRYGLYPGRRSDPTVAVGHLPPAITHYHFDPRTGKLIPDIPGGN